VGKGASAPCPPSRASLGMVGTLPPSLVELRRTSRCAHPRFATRPLGRQGCDEGAEFRATSHQPLSQNGRAWSLDA
jgi:hypothetical protein